MRDGDRGVSTAPSGASLWSPAHAEARCVWPVRCRPLCDTVGDVMGLGYKTPSPPCPATLPSKAWEVLELLSPALLCSTGAALPAAEGEGSLWERTLVGKC